MKILQIADFSDAIEKTKEILYEKVDKKTVLFLSGGSTPKSLYTSLAKDKIIHPAIVGMIDERFGEKFHETSNELMIRETGFLEYLEKSGIPFYPIIQKKMSREKDAEQYDKVTRDLFFHFPKSIAIMGIGEDSHTAGIVPESKTSKKSSEFVISYNNKKMSPPERITMTFAGLALIDFFIVLAFGKEKKNALKHMFEQGSVEEVPGRFFVKQAFDKTVLITDQQV